MTVVADDLFKTRFEPHRRSITGHCYRMLGSLQDAEEVVQESLLRAWQRRDEVQSSDATRAWLYKIATNACLDVLRKTRRRRVLPNQVGTPPSTAVRLGAATEEHLWVEPAPDSLFDKEDAGAPRPDDQVSLRENVGLAFITALQLLSPKQRAALLLVDVLGWNPEEAAELLETRVSAVNSLLQRARQNVAHRNDSAPSNTTMADPALVRRFITTWESGDLEAFAALLATDALLVMPPQPEWFAGREVIRQFFAAVWKALPGERRVVPIAANGGPAVAVYRRPPLGDYEPSGIMLLTIRGGQVAQMTRFGSAKLFPLFGLPLAPP